MDILSAGLWIRDVVLVPNGVSFSISSSGLMMFRQRCQGLNYLLFSPINTWAREQRWRFFSWCRIWMNEWMLNSRLKVKLNTLETDGAVIRSHHLQINDGRSLSDRMFVFVMLVTQTIAMHKSSILETFPFVGELMRLSLFKADLRFKHNNTFIWW